jgi:uncharacterized secreted repeat protein (TIGR03808 family)
LLLPAAAKGQTLAGRSARLAGCNHFGCAPRRARQPEHVALQEAINRSCPRRPSPFHAGRRLFGQQHRSAVRHSRIVGVPGRTRIRYAGDGHLLFGTDVRDVRLEGLVLDGNNRPLADYTPALLHISTGANIAVEDCIIQGSLTGRCHLRSCGGARRELLTISGILGAAFQSNDAQGLAMRDNTVERLLRQWHFDLHAGARAATARSISGNRIERIRAVSGGTGPYGNGINVFRANDVIISGNADRRLRRLRCALRRRLQCADTSATHARELAKWRCSPSSGFARRLIVANNVIDGAAAMVSQSQTSPTMAVMAIVWRQCVRNLAGPDAASPPSPRPMARASPSRQTRAVTNNI